MPLQRAGTKIWVTRSEPGASRLARVLQDAGYQSWVAPVLRIEPLPPTAGTGLVPHGGPTAEPSIVIVLSEHAVLLGQHLPWQRWVASGAEVMAVGERTASALRWRGVKAISPLESSSEGLLAELLPAQRVAGRQILVLTGRGGRQTLRQTLTQRGGTVTELALYQRVPVGQLTIPLGTIGAICVSSGDGLQAADGLWSEASMRRDLPVFAPSQRVVEMAQGIGWNNAYNCAGAAPAAVLQTINQHYRTNA